MKKKTTLEMFALLNKGLEDFEEWMFDATFLRDNLHCLNDREREVLRLRLGLDDGQTHTLQEIGKEFGVTKDRIRQIGAKAWRKLMVRKHRYLRGESN